MIAQGKKPRVCVVLVAPSCRRLLGGQEVQANLLLQNWEHDTAVTVIFVPNDPALPRFLASVEQIAYLRTLVRFPFFVRKLWQASKRADIVHAFSASHFSFLLTPMPAWAVSKLLGKKIVINYHSGKAGEHLHGSAMARWMLRHVDAIIVPSQYLVEIFRVHGLNATIVPNVIDSHISCVRPPHSASTLLLCTRNFASYYGIDIVIRAFVEVKKAFADARLCLVGKGPEEDAIRNLILKLGVGDVELAGSVGRERIGEYYHRADVFVNGSWIDNMPVSMLECFASGVPVVTTSAGGIPYLIKHEHTGLICEKGDWRALARNVIRILRDNDLREKITRNAYQQCSMYRWDKIRPAWLKIYHTGVNATGLFQEVDDQASIADWNNSKIESPYKA